jgi:hypothetical protein
MDINKLFLVSLIIYAITGAIFFLTFEVILILLYFKTKKIIDNVDRISTSVVGMSEEIKKKIRAIDIVSSVAQFIKGYLRKE